jgi:hypothetical protein
MKFSSKCPTCGKPIHDKRRSYCSEVCRPHAPCRRCGKPAVCGRYAGCCSWECKEFLRLEGLEKLSQRVVARAKEIGPAHYAVKKALKDGTLARKPCEVCGSSKSIPHHPDYSKKLDVRWLCRTHHQLEHARLRKEGTDPMMPSVI